MSLIIPVYQGKCQTKSWKTELKEAISDPKQLMALLKIRPEQLNFDIDPQNDFVVRAPKPFIKKMEIGNPKDPLFLQVISQMQENDKVVGYGQDPLQENDNRTPGLLHKYHGRVLLILSSACAINCRYCFRRHFPYQDQLSSGEQLNESIDYIKSDKSITEVILSGGDPLIVSDNFLNDLIAKLESISHLKRLRIHTRLPIVIPQRITDKLCEILQNTRLEVSMVLHINHPNEIDTELTNNLLNLVRAGVVLLNQSVLLKAVNDSSRVLCQLSEKLFSAKIIPYYLHQLDKVEGAAHFNISDLKALTLIKEMRNKLPGYLVPRLAKEETEMPAKTIML
jgi:EF-P beta-lysylation protein EpmB